MATIRSEKTAKAIPAPAITAERSRAAPVSVKNGRNKNGDALCRMLHSFLRLVERCPARHAAAMHTRSGSIDTVRPSAVVSAVPMASAPRKVSHPAGKIMAPLICERQGSQRTKTRTPPTTALHVSCARQSIMKQGSAVK